MTNVQNGAGKQASADEIRAWLVARIARAIDIDAAAFDSSASFTSLGLGSRESLTITGEMEEWLGRPLSASLLWEYPTVDKLTAHLLGEGSESELEEWEESPVW